MFDGGGSLRGGGDVLLSLISDSGARAVVIGAVALAAHRYVRHTEDLGPGG